MLSRQIRALESELHADLFTRDRRRVELTAAGRALGAEAPALLAAAEAARRRVGRAARGGAKLVVAFMPGLQVTKAVSALETAHPLVDVEVLRTGWNDQVDVLHDGRADVSFVRLPINTKGLHVRDLGGEPRAVVLARNHPLAGAPGYRLAELADEHLLQSPGAVPEWADVATEMLQASRQSGRDDRLGVEEKLENVARGRGIAILPASVIVSYLRVARTDPRHITESRCRGLEIRSTRRAPARVHRDRTHDREPRSQVATHPVRYPLGITGDQESLGRTCAVPVRWLLSPPYRPGRREQHGRPPMSLTGSTVVIIGGTSGIGLATAKLAAACGANVVIGSRSPERIDSALTTLPAGVIGHPVDASAPESLDDFFERVGELDHLVYTAADVMATCFVEDFTADAFAAFMKLRLVGAINAARAGVPRIKPQGSLTLTSGTAAFRPAPDGCWERWRPAQAFH